MINAIFQIWWLWIAAAACLIQAARILLKKD